MSTSYSPRDMVSSVTIANTTITRTPSLKQEDDLPSPGLSTRNGEILPMIPDENEPTWPCEWQAYTALVGCFFLMFNSWGLVNAYGTFATIYKESLLEGRDLFLFNLIGSTESFIVLIFSFAVGRLLNAGLSRIVLPTGFVLVTLGVFMLSLSSGDGSNQSGNYGLIWLTQGLTAGLRMVCFFVASSQSRSLLPNTFLHFG
jgi:MCP family monocarboxylic acid transporter-like MFS transporter 10